MSGNELVAGYRAGSESSNRRQMMLNQNIKYAGEGLGGMFRNWLPLETQYDLGMIREDQLAAGKVRQSQVKQQSELWTRHEDSMAYNKYKETIKAGGKAEYTGGDHTPLTDSELKLIGQPTSWEKRADFEAERLTRADMLPSQKQKVIDGWDDLTRSHHGLPVWSHEEKLEQYKGELLMGYAEGRLDDDGLEEYFKVFGRPEGKDARLRQEIADWSAKRVNWLEYLDKTGVVESELTPEQRKKHLKQAFNRDWESVVDFNYLQGKHGVRLAIRTPEKTLSQFHQAKARFIAEVGSADGLGEMEKAHMIQAVNGAMNYSDLKAIRGPRGEDYGASAFSGVKGFENQIILEAAQLTHQKLSDAAKTARLNYEDARQRFLNYESPADKRARELEEKVAEEERALQGRKDIAEFVADIRRRVESGETDILKSPTGASLFSGMTRLLIANNAEYGTPFLDASDAKMMEDLLVEMAADYKERMKEAKDAGQDAD